MLCSLDDPESQFSQTSGLEPSRFAISLRVLGRNGGRASLSEGVGEGEKTILGFSRSVLNSRPKLSRLLQSSLRVALSLLLECKFIAFSFVSL